MLLPLLFDVLGICYIITKLLLPIACLMHLVYTQFQILLIVL